RRADSDGVVAVVRIAREPDRGARQPRESGETPAAIDPVAGAREDSLAVARSRRSAGDGVSVARPLAHVADDVVEPERIRPERADGRGQVVAVGPALELKALVRRVALRELVREVGRGREIARVVSRPPRRGRPRPRGVLPLLLGRDREPEPAELAVAVVP